MREIVTLREATQDDWELMMAWRSSPLILGEKYTQKKPLTWDEHYLFMTSRGRWWKFFIILVNDFVTTRKVGVLNFGGLENWNPELQLGLGILIGWWLAQWEGKKRAIKYILIGLLIVSWGLVADKRVIKQWRRSIAKTVEYKIGQELVSLVQAEETVFLSGSTVFWLNSLTDVRQVRGGVDQAAVDQNWRAAAWEVREGSDGNLAINKLKELKVKWLVVHTSESEEFYHDFKQVNKFEKIKNLVKVYDQSGDRIYRLE